MSTPIRMSATASVALLCLGLSACAGSATSELTVEGSFTGTKEEKCLLALREVGGNEKLVDSVSVGTEFREVFAVAPDRRQYFVQVNCDDRKSGRSPAFYFEPPRSGMKLQQILVN